MHAMHGTNASDGSSVTANCNGLPVCNRIASKLTKVLHPESMSHSLKRESDPKGKDNLALVAAFILTILVHINPCRYNMPMSDKRKTTDNTLKQL